MTTNRAVAVDIVGAAILYTLIFLSFRLRRVVDRRTLLNLFSGRYRRAVQEDRVFMFLDMVNSTQVAEQLGEVGAYDLLSSFFFDIDEAITEFRGVPYRYIGDGTVITWSKQKAMNKANCIRCFFAMQDIIKRRADYYQARFGWVPEFRAGLHCGPVAVGECGDTHREIHYFGDTVNTASRIENQCRALNQRFLVSNDVIKELTLPNFMKATSLGAFQLRGRKGEIGLWTVQISNAE